MASSYGLRDSGKEVIPSRGGSAPQESPEKEVYFTPTQATESTNTISADILRQEKYIHIPDGLQHSREVDKYPIRNPGHDFPEAVPSFSPIKNPRRFKFIMILVLVFVAIVLGATLGGVLGTRNRSNTVDDRNENSSEAPVPSSLSKNSHLAALGYIDQETPKTRVYYQNSSGYIWEARQDGENAAWTRIPLNVRARMGSPLAAAVSRPGYSLEISIFTLDESNTIHGHNWSSSTGQWISRPLSSDWKASQTTSLTTMFNQCARCSNESLLFFQDKNQVVQMANHTSTGWIKTPLPLSAVTGSGLAVVPFLRGGKSDQQNLYYQRQSDDVLTLATGNEERGWHAETSKYRGVPEGTMLAVASSYNNVSSGAQEWIQLLSTNRFGLSLDTWSGGEYDWLVHGSRPLSMSNGTYPRTFNSISVTALGTAFATANNSNNQTVIESWKVDSDMLTWISTGSVDVGDA